MRQEDPRMALEEPGFDAFPYSDIKARDFYNRFMNGEKPETGWVNETDFETEEINLR
jgi:hypothetical protein